MYESQQPTTPGMHWSWANLLQVAQNMATPFAQNYQASRQLRLEEKRQEDANQIALSQLANDLRRIEQTDNQLEQQYKMHSELLGLDKDRLEHQKEVDAFNQEMADLMHKLEVDKANTTKWLGLINAKLAERQQSQDKYVAELQARGNLLMAQAQLQAGSFVYSNMMLSLGQGNNMAKFFNNQAQRDKYGVLVERYKGILNDAIMPDLEKAKTAIGQGHPYVVNPDANIFLLKKTNDDGSISFKLEANKTELGTYRQERDPATGVVSYTFTPTIGITPQNDPVIKYAALYGVNKIYGYHIREAETEWSKYNKELETSFLGAGDTTPTIFDTKAWTESFNANNPAPVQTQYEPIEELPFYKFLEATTEESK